MAAPSVLTALEAVGPATKSRIMDASADRYPQTLLGLFLADQEVSGRKNLFSIESESGPDTDYKLRFETDAYETIPDARFGKNYADTKNDPQLIDLPFETRFGMAGKKGGAWIQEAETNKITKSAMPFEWVNMQADKIKFSMYRALQTDILAYGETSGILPLRDGMPQPDWATWGQTAGRLMHVAYPLMGGGTDNAVSTTGTYQYGENLNLNSGNNVNIKAVTEGDGSTPFGNPTPSNIRGLLNRMKDNDRRYNTAGGNIYAVTDSEVYEWILDYGEDKVQIIQPSGEFRFGYNEIAEFAGVRWVREPDLDAAVADGNDHIILFLNPNTWTFRHYKFGEIRGYNQNELPGRVGIAYQWDWDFAASLICNAPWRNGLAWDVTV